jgi:hypothetical protein
MTESTKCRHIPLKKFQVKAIVFERPSIHSVNKDSTINDLPLAVRLVKTRHQLNNNPAYCNTAWCLVTKIYIYIST